MAVAEAYRFGAFRLEIASGRLWRGPEPVPLGPRIGALLRTFLESPRLLLTHEDLLRKVWSDVHVAEGALKVSINELRRVLGDDAAKPSFVETVHRRGYRFLADVVPETGPGASGGPAFAWTPAVTRGPQADPPVGREAELARLGRHLDAARRGERRVILLGGEAGIGKTTVVTELLRRIAGDAWVTGGHCHERHGVAEAYAPFVEALSRLARLPEAAALVTRLRLHAPSWVSRISEARSGRATGASSGGFDPRPERMPRELAEALEAISDGLFVLVLEDLHWADSSTLDLLCLLATRSDPARLFVLATLRPPETDEAGKRLRPLRALVAAGRVEEIRLGPFAEEDVAAYVRGRFPRNEFPPETAATLHRSTGGHPLFFASALEEAVADGRVREIGGAWSLREPSERLSAGIPQNVRELVRLRRDRLETEDRRLLEVASVAGEPFAAAAVGGALELDPDEVEERFERLARPGLFLVAIGIEERSAAISGVYGFRHAIFQAVLYDDLGEARRVRLHRAIGESLGAWLGADSVRRAHELSLHFEKGHDARRAITWAATAAEEALGAAEAGIQAQRGLALLAAEPALALDSAERMRLELVLGRALTATTGYLDRNAGAAFERAHDIASARADRTARAWISFGLGQHRMIRGELRRAHETAVAGIDDAVAAAEPGLAYPLHLLAGMVLVYEGRFREAAPHLEEGRVRYDPRLRARYPALIGYEPRALVHVVEAMAAWPLGFPDRARESFRRGIEEAAEHPFTQALVRTFAGWLEHWRGDAEAALAHAGVVRELSAKNGFRFWALWADWSGGQALTALGRGAEGLRRMREAIEALTPIDVISLSRSLACEAEALAQAGRTAEGLERIALALDRPGREECVYWDAEIWRIRGDLLLAAGRTREARESLDRALAVARAQQAASFELRAATSLCRAARGKERARARELLARILDRLTEGFDSAALREAGRQLGSRS